MKQKLSLVKTLLINRKARAEKGLFVVEGPRLVEEAAERIEFVVYTKETPLVLELKGMGRECLKVTDKEFAVLSSVETPQGMIAVSRQPIADSRDLFSQKNPLIVFCIEIQDPGNLGTIIRTADAVGASGVIISKGSVDVYNPKVVRSTMGSIFHLPIVQVEETGKTIKKLKEKNVKIIAADLNAKKDLYSVDLKGPVAIMVGNEGKGIGDRELGLADETIRIPMPGQAESLNAAVSSAIILYEALRQRSAG